jgi:hypothetical protein
MDPKSASGGIEKFASRQKTSLEKLQLELLTKFLYLNANEPVFG